MPTPHPFLVDQRPYLARASSSSSITSNSSAGSVCTGVHAVPSTYTHSNATHTTLSSTSTIVSGALPRGQSRTASPPAPVRAAVDEGVERDCLRFMRGVELLERNFGSCKRSGGLSEEERNLRREMRSVEEQRVAADEEEAAKAQKKRRRLGRIF